MKKIGFLISLIFLCRLSYSQEPIKFETKPVGGKAAVQQVLETQLTLPKILLTPDLEQDIAVSFDLDSTGHAININLSKRLNSYLREEIRRIFRFIEFEPTQSSLAEKVPYQYVLSLSKYAYNNYFKQRNKISLKKLSADSSFVIYNKADRSPEFYKGGEEGLSEYILNEIEYPQLAKERSIEGTVVLEYVVETNGYVTAVKVLQGVNGGCSEEAIRLISESRWQPAVVGGKYVRYKMTYPITFSLRNVNKDGTSSVGQ